MVKASRFSREEHCSLNWETVFYCEVRDMFDSFGYGRSRAPYQKSLTRDNSPGSLARRGRNPPDA